MRLAYRWYSNLCPGLGWRLTLGRLAVASMLACHDEPLTSPIVATGPMALPVLTRDTAPLFQTDSLAYTLRNGVLAYEADLAVRFVNRTSAAISFVNCGGSTSFVFEKLVDGAWVFAWAPSMPTCLSTPIVVAPAASHVFSVSVYGGYPDCRCSPRFAQAEPAGVYRIVWGPGLSTAGGSASAPDVPVPMESRVSNRFTLAPTTP